MQELYLNEAAFHEFIINRIANEGYLSRVFFPFVSYNTALFLSKNLWPSKYDFFKEENKMPFFAASEKKWQRNLKKLKSSLCKDTATDYKLTGEKNFAVKSEDLLILAREKNTLALIHARTENISNWIRKKEELFMPENPENFPYLETGDFNELLDHYEIQFDFRLPNAEDNIKYLSTIQYQYYGHQIRLREFTSFAIAAYGMILFLGVKKNQQDMLHSKKEKIIEYRSEKKRKSRQHEREILEESKYLFHYLYEHSENKKINLHPMWYAPQKMKI